MYKLSKPILIQNMLTTFNKCLYFSS